jgi:hypothetical protein
VGEIFLSWLERVFMISLPGYADANDDNLQPLKSIDTETLSNQPIFNIAESLGDPVKSAKHPASGISPLTKYTILLCIL